ncbi:MAG TPA: hypothetical protein VIE17_10560 [Methylophilaceae bacterium]
MISSIFDFLSSSPTNTKKSWWLQSGQSIGDSIKQAASDAAAKRKALAAERLKALAERLRVLMLLASTDGKNSKGKITAAAGIAREIAATVKDYAGASADLAAQSATSSNGSAASAIGDSTTTATATATAATAVATINITATTTTTPLSHEDEAFLNTAVQLSSQVRFFISQEIQKARQKHQDPDTHQGDINIMDNAIIDAAKSFGVSTDGTTVYPKPFSATFISIMT